MTTEDPRIAPLRRKMAATQEPAKAAELAVVLRGLGFDPDAVETVSVAPKGRTAPVKVTAAPTRPVAKAAVAPAAPESKETSKETAAKPASTPRRTPRKQTPVKSKENE